MKMSLTPATPWSTAELDPSDKREVQERLSGIPFLGRAAVILAGGLEPGSSRTIYALPVNVASSGDALRTMVSAARSVAEVVREMGDVEGIDPNSMPFEVRHNGKPEEFDQRASVPTGAKASMDLDEPIGYVRVEMRDDTAHTTVGSLDPRAHTHHAVDYRP
jgi:hypothetical protein